MSKSNASHASVDFGSQSGRCSVALLELLAAAAGARIIAAHAGVRIRHESRFGNAGPPALDRRWRRLATRDQTVGGWFGRDHGCLAATRPREPAGRSGDRAVGPLRSLATLPWRRSDLDLQSEPPLRERGLQIVHQTDEHLVGILLVLDERVLLSPRPVIDPLAQLVEIVEVILPLLVDHAERHV